VLSVLKYTIFSILILAGSLSAHAARDYGSHSGYVSTTQGEKDDVYVDMVVISDPRVDGGPSLRELIFNEKLSKEFSDRYDEKFGRTEGERAYQSPNQYTQYNDFFGFKGSARELSDERRRFGEYMIRRLAEFHIDHYAKNDPKVRPVWEAKERLSNIALEVDRFRFDLQYSISGNTLDVKVINPWLTLSQVRMEMNPEAFGPSQVREAMVSLGRPLSDRIFLESHLRLEDGIVSLVGRRAMSQRLSTSLSASTFTKDKGMSRRESVYLAGLGFVF
jgi:hypothetical protein